MPRALTGVDRSPTNHPVSLECLVACLISVTVSNSTHCMLSFQRKVFHRHSAQRQCWERVGHTSSKTDSPLIANASSLYNNDRRTGKTFCICPFCPQLRCLGKWFHQPSVIAYYIPQPKGTQGSSPVLFCLLMPLFRGPFSSIPPGNFPATQYWRQ